MEKKNGVIFGAGSFDEGSEELSARSHFGQDSPFSAGLVIAADGGYLCCRRIGHEPDVLLGDFDSLREVPSHRNLIRHSPVKDDTDMALAADYALREDCGRLFLYGGLGGRPDHTLANLQLLKRLSRQGTEAYLIGEGCIITALTEGAIQFPAGFSGIVSVFSGNDQCTGVTETGLKYELDREPLSGDRALGVSNEFTGRPAMVKVEKGTLLIFWDITNGFAVERM